MEYLPVQIFSDQWNISKRRIQILCKEGRIDGAKMIGNMWVIPQNAERPSDARSKNPVIGSEEKSPDTRRELRPLLKRMFQKCREIQIPENHQKTTVLAALACALCSYYLNLETCPPSIYETIYRQLSEMQPHAPLDPELFQLALHFAETRETDSRLDNILSWAYQYTNKFTDSLYRQTQFFTEPYMITYLVKRIPELFQAQKIVDPCSGGGNFLAECLEALCQDCTDVALLETLVQHTERLYGYDIDPDIARLAVVNIRLRALSILKKRGIPADFQIWDSLKPNLFYSAENDPFEGSLAVHDKKVIHVITQKKESMKHALTNADVILTNPPFATVKGMPQAQKDFLKANYPDANCDTCVSFLLALYHMLGKKGICGIVSQNSWMHLKTFQAARDTITKQYTIYHIANLGSGAFCDLSGEKSNVSLLILGKEKKEEHEVQIFNLSAYSLDEKIKRMGGELTYIKLPQQDINGPNGYDLTEKGALKAISASDLRYHHIAVPMQGTSTGNSKELVGYFWEHFRDNEWIPVSNGGGYCRWEGLNNSVVKWGTDGEYIKAQKGSALRNVKYFPETQMVFSDTGTAGLNVRVLLKDQIFIASGPGIRITKGNPYAHLAFLNSRLAAYYVRIMSPKLTIAAGYIGQIPARETVCSSIVLEQNARTCIELKKRTLSKRPSNLEYDPSFLNDMPNDLSLAAWQLFNEDLTNELWKLEIESKTDQFISRKYELSQTDLHSLDQTVGECAYLIHSEKDFELAKLDLYMNERLDASCSLKRTKTSKAALGSDGILEFAAKDLTVNPEQIVKRIQENPGSMKRVLSRYQDMILHNAILSCLDYHPKQGLQYPDRPISAITASLTLKFGNAIPYLDWIESSFNSVHKEIFKGTPFLIYENGELHQYD